MDAYCVHLFDEFRKCHDAVSDETTPQEIVSYFFDKNKSGVMAEIYKISKKHPALGLNTINMHLEVITGGLGMLLHLREQFVELFEDELIEAGELAEEEPTEATAMTVTKHDDDSYCIETETSELNVSRDELEELYLQIKEKLLHDD